MPRSLTALPKAHLHLHFTGAMRHATLVELAHRHRVRLPSALTDEWPPRLSGTDERGWFRFQRLYDMARSVLRTPADVRRLLTEIAEDERAEGSGWLEVQVDPDGYAARFGGITAVLDLVLESARRKYHVTLSALRRFCAPYLRFSPPQGGIYFWLELAPEVDAARFRELLDAEGVGMAPGERFTPDEGGRRFFRLAFLDVTDHDLEAGIAVIGQCLARSTPGGTAIST